MSNLEPKIVGYTTEFRDFNEHERKPFGAHKYVRLNGDRKAIELKGVMTSYTIFYEFPGGEVRPLHYYTV